MEVDYSALEEFDIIRNIQTPYLIYKKLDSVAKKNIAYNVLARKAEDILLISALGFREESVIAGLSEKHIEHIAKHGPRKYKENILEIFSDGDSVAEIKEIARVMDEDSTGGATPNQQRIRNVMKYARDNQRVFQF